MLIDDEHGGCVSTEVCRNPVRAAEAMGGCALARVPNADAARPGLSRPGRARDRLSHCRGVAVLTPSQVTTTLLPVPERVEAAMLHVHDTAPLLFAGRHSQSLTAVKPYRLTRSPRIWRRRARSCRTGASMTMPSVGDGQHTSWYMVS